MTTGGETIIYQDKSVTITNARAILGGTTFAMANITSVRHVTEPGEIALLLILALLSFLGVVLGFNGEGSHIVGWLGLLGGAVFGVAAYANRRSKHWVSIGTAGAERKAIFSYDEGWTTTVVSALNNAIISRG